MRRLKQFTELDRGERSLLFHAMLLVLVARMGLWIMPLRVLLRLVLLSRDRSTPARSAERLVWAIRVVSRYMPGATCLVQALATQALLTRSGFFSRIQIGVAKDEQCRFKAHAWVVCGDRIVIGGTETDHYVPLAAWQSW